MPNCIVHCTVICVGPPDCLVKDQRLWMLRDIQPAGKDIAIELSIEEVWRKKPSQTDVVVLWGKIAMHNAHASIQTV